MRSLLAAVFLLASAYVAQAGVLVELTDGTTLTVESHWTDGEQVHLVRGGVDMIVPKAKIKSMNDDVDDPEIYRDGEGAGSAARTGPAEGQAEGQAEGEDGGGEEVVEAEEEKPLSEMSAAELQALHEEEARRIIEAQEKRFAARYGGGATDEEKRSTREAFQKESKRHGEIWSALQKAEAAEAKAAGEPTQPTVAQPGD